MPHYTASAVLEKESLYKVIPRFGNVESAVSFTVTGGELAADGIEIPLQVEQHGDFKGCLWEITKE